MIGIVVGAIGGFIYLDLPRKLYKTGEALKEFGLRQLVGGHCTGIHEARKIADIANIHQSNLSHGAIGTVVTRFKNNPEALLNNAKSRFNHSSRSDNCCFRGLSSQLSI